VTRPAKSVVGAVRQGCPRCGAPVIRELVGDRAGLLVTADDVLFTAAEAASLAGPNRLAWCLRESRWAGLSLRWTSSVDGPGCGWPHVLCHQCPAASAGRQQGGLW